MDKRTFITDTARRFKTRIKSKKTLPVLFRLGTQVKASKSIHLSVQTSFKEGVKHVGL